MATARGFARAAEARLILGAARGRELSQRSLMRGLPADGTLRKLSLSRRRGSLSPVFQNTERSAMEASASGAVLWQALEWSGVERPERAESGFKSSRCVAGSGSWRLTGGPGFARARYHGLLEAPVPVLAGSKACSMRWFLGRGGRVF